MIGRSVSLYALILSITALNLFCQYEQGIEPVGPVVPYMVKWWPGEISRELSVSVNRTQLQGSTRDSVEIRVLLFDTTQGVPLKKRPIYVTSDIGTVTPAVLTNDSGVARVWFKAAPFNTVALCKIVLSESESPAFQDSVKFILSGVTLESLTTQALVRLGDTLRCKVRVLDGLGWPVPGAELSVSGAAAAKAIADSAGVVSIPFIGTAAGKYTLEFSYSNLVKKVSVTVSESLSFLDKRSNLRS